MRLLQGQSTFNYNAFDLPVYRTTDIKAEPVLDIARRAVIYVRYTISCNFRLTEDDADDFDTESNGATDALMESLRQQLSAPACPLKLTDTGFGDLSVNVPDGETGSSGKWDVNYGPICRSFGWKPVAGKRACEVRWVLEVCIPECPTAVYKVNLMMLNFNASITVDQQGYSTRTINFVAEIPATRDAPDATSIPDHVDRVLEDITPEIPDRFRRTNSTHSYDEAKKVLHASFVDTEIPPNILPDGVVEMRASHSGHSTGSTIVGKYMMTIAAQITLVKTAPRDAALGVFLDLVQQRYNVIKTRVGRRGTVFPTAIEMEEPDIFGRDTGSFSLTFLVINNDASKLPAQFGLWVPTNTDYNTWKASLGDVMGPRGLAGLKGVTGDDIILDLCVDNTPPTASAAALAAGSVEVPVASIETNVEFGFSIETPAPEDSWVRYENDLEALIDNNIVKIKRLPLDLITQVRDQPGGTQESTTAPTVQQIGGLPDSVEYLPDRIQQRAAPDVRFIMKGVAVRLFYPVNPPNILTIGGLTAYPKRSKVKQSQIGNFGLPLYRCDWEFEYELETIPSPQVTIGAPQNQETGSGDKNPEAGGDPGNYMTGFEGTATDPASILSQDLGMSYDND
jgi:hypothetical protein